MVITTEPGNASLMEISRSFGSAVASYVQTDGSEKTLGMHKKTTLVGIRTTCRKIVWTIGQELQCEGHF